MTDTRRKEGGSESEPIDLLVDTIIGFLEKGTSYTRSIGNQSFALLSGLVKESTIDLVVTVCRTLIPLLLT
jgi:DNA polymerase phi